MPNVTVYIRKEDLDKWKVLKDKSEAIHKLLNVNGELHEMVWAKGNGDTPLVGPEIPIDEPEESDIYKGLVLELATGRVLDTINGEVIDDVDRETVKELKKRGQVE